MIKICEAIIEFVAFLNENSAAVKNMNAFQSNIMYVYIKL